MTSPVGIDVGAVERWFADNVEGAQPPLQFDRITGGHSNLTYLVTDADGGQCVLRRPPEAEVLATAHDVAREHAIMAALVGSDVPVPKMLGVCHDVEVTGAPFFVMAFVDGVVLNTAADADRSLASHTARQRAGETLVDALAALHAVDIDAVGLGNLSRRDGYLERQLRRWSAQWAATHLDDLDGMASLHDWLVGNRPVEKGPVEASPWLVHGDFRLGNTLLGPDGSVLAVVDWELSTLGEPLSDVAYFLRSWTAADARSGQGKPPAVAPGFSGGEELAARYAARSGHSIDNLGYWMAFTAWRAAAMLGGVYRRYLDDQLGTPPDDLTSCRAEVESRMQQGMEHASLS